MNILFLTLNRFGSINDRGIYPDLLRYFKEQGHKIFVVTSSERRYGEETSFATRDDVGILNVKTFNIQKTSVLEKGIGTLLIGWQYKKAIKRFLNEPIDLILYSTPPITLVEAVNYVKKRDNAKTYLLLKDIFPQNAVDLGMFKQGSFMYSYFRKQEIALYNISDYIGCMSPANVEFVLANNPSLDENKVEICPNSIEIVDQPISDDEKCSIRSKYNIPHNAVVYIYGGNLGKPQGLDFLLQLLDSNNNKSDRFFFIIGSGTEYPKMEAWMHANADISNALLLPYLPKEEYDLLIKACDVGLIFLDKRFTIPNYPSRLLSYLENRMPILMATDVNTDIGSIAQANGYGFWTENGDLLRFNEYIEHLVQNRALINQMGQRGFEHLTTHYTTQQSYHIIVNHF